MNHKKERNEQILKHASDGLKMTDIADVMNLTYETVRCVIRRNRDKIQPSEFKEIEASEINGDVAIHVARMTDAEIYDFFKKDPEKYDLQRQRPTLNTKGNSHFQVIFKAKSVMQQIDFEELFKRLCNRPMPKSWVGVEKHKIGDKLAVLAAVDFHMPKLAWASETGDNYDMKIARKSVDYVFQQSYEYMKENDIKKAIVPIGQDLLHFDSNKPFTSAGTLQDTDVRWKKMIDTVCETMIDNISRLSEVANITLVWSRGNHDETLSYAIFKVLEAYFNNYDRVTPILNHKPRQYYQFGVNMICFTHSDKEGKRLPMMLSTEEPMMFAATTDRHVIAGHFHTYKVEEIHGIMIHHCSSISGTDYWHAESGYVGNKKAMQLLVFDKKNGIDVVKHIAVPKNYYK
ncbi:hypothetical protein [Culicoidibacter larvae]|uniref:Winged helix-turn-helix domain-containing protein n=1 Tax=Culicoidibacter larvae TaxID=2579976 RepID=A0A5R8QAD6_9FIRM|nr:hypothetical protein [Culicoidibacter larvae]TLG72066.1 hypothetical protein FEZ08_09545 [Culicoidibacter larvae]